MSTRTRRVVRVSTVAAWVVVLAGVGVVASTALFLTAGEPWNVVNDWSLLVMIAALAPLMLAFYELGGRTPLRLAQLAQVLGWASVIGWVGLQKLVIFNLMTFDIHEPMTGWFALASLALGYVGLWIAGANLLAGPWLPSIRWVGVLAGLALVVFAFGLLSGGVDTGWAALGGLATMLLVPLWAVLMAAVLRRLAASEAV